ncbi:MAG TPA: tetratricopeptide repeat protein [Kofleriaceae bacterium]|nr:tetratricopeptide repeat protein [Kofleriaceae bacterium]
MPKTIGLSSALLALAVAASPALAQKSPRQQADELNDQGKQYFAEKRYEDAYGMFRQAATLSPEARFFFNMCYALNFLERYQDAIQACEQVPAAEGADAALKEKTDRALASLREKLAAQQAATGGGGSTTPPDPNGGGGGGTTAGGGGAVTSGGPASGGPPPAGGAPAAAGEDPFVATEAPPPDDSYQWSVGGDIGFLGNVNAGEDEFGNPLYAEGGFNLRLFANFIIHQGTRLGVQGYLGIGALPPNEDYNTDSESLGMFDLGGAFFTHRPLVGHLYWTPLVGLSLAVRQPQELTQGFISLGSRAEVGFSYVFGPGGEHAFSVTPGFNIYFPSSGEQEHELTGEPRAASYYGFDETRALFALNFGYTYRFSTPFGSTPLITLE